MVDLPQLKLDLNEMSFKKVYSAGDWPWAVDKELFRKIMTLHQMTLLFLPTQIRFPIEVVSRVMC